MSQIPDVWASNVAAVMSEMAAIRRGRASLELYARDPVRWWIEHPEAVAVGRPNLPECWGEAIGFGGRA